MKPEFDADKSIYLQIAESIEDDILQKMIEEEAQAPSTNQLAVMYRINPATSAKGINLLISEGILYKRRGIGMFVSTGAVKKIRIKRKRHFTKNTLAHFRHLSFSGPVIPGSKWFSGFTTTSSPFFSRRGSR